MSDNLQVIKLDQSVFLGKKPLITPTEGIWIAGGAIRQWFNGNEAPSDIDIFGFSEEKLKAFEETTFKGFKKLVENAQLSSYSYHGQLVQVIKYDFYNNVADLLDSFDFSVCQFAWDGAEVYATQSAVISVLRKHLRVHKISKELAADSLRRAFKYQRKGYEPCLGTIRDLALSFQSLTESQIQEQISISPGGGLRTVGVD